jgi:hypothetical protein
MEEKQFRVKAGTFNEIKSKLYIENAILWTSITLIMDFILLYNNPSNKHSTKSDILFVLVSILIASYIGIKVESKKAKRVYETYTITFTPSSIRREIKDVPVLEVENQDIKKIMRLKNGSFYFTSKDKLSPMIIPYQIEFYNEVENLLKEIKPFYNKKVYDLTPYRIHIQVFFFLLYITVFAADRPIIIIISGILSLTVTVYSILSIYKGKNTDKNTQNSGIFLFIIGIAIMLRLWWLWFKSTQL